MKIATTKQGDWSVSEYAQTLQNLWMKLDHYEQFEAKCTEDADLLKRYKKDKIYKFSTGLNQWQNSQPGGVAPKMEIDKGENKDSLWCTFCKKRRHPRQIMETSW